MPNREPAQNTLVALRARLRKARLEMPDAERERGGLLIRGRLFTWLNVAREKAAAEGRKLDTVAAYWPLEGEVDLRPLLRQWVENGVKVCLPCVVAKDRPLEFRNWEPDGEMAAGRYGIPEPAGEACAPDVILVPTLGYTANADRLGYGGGYYDRTLAAQDAAGRHPVTIGIAWPHGKLPDDYLPAAHDMRLDAVLSSEGWLPRAPLDAGPGAGKPDWSSTRI